MFQQIGAAGYTLEHAEGPVLTISRDGHTWALYADGKEVGILHYGDDHVWHFHGQADKMARGLFDALELMSRQQY